MGPWNDNCHLSGMSKLWCLLVILMVQSNIWAGGSDAISHELWDGILNSHVDEQGRVDYIGIKEDGRFQEYLNLVSSVHPDEGWSENEQLAYWINTYNAFTIAKVLEHWPVKSIKDIEGVWDRPFIKIEQATYSLNGIEHDIIRARFKDARIHFALNCAAISCPPLWNRAFTAKGLKDELEARTNRFINEDDRNRLSHSSIELSRIFEWYAEDFGNVKEYISRYSEIAIDDGLSIRYLEYDWALNKKQ